MPVSAEQKVAAKAAPARPDKPAGKVWAVQAVIVAVALFAAVNAVLFVACGQEKSSSDMWSGSGSIDLAVDGYKNVSAPPKVVLLGSSLMMFPFWAMDKESNRGIGDIFHHHDSQTLRQELAKHGVPAANIYSFAIFGQMVSDAYIYVNEYLKGQRAPEYLVYGIAPRDFSDHDLPAPMATLTFKRLVGLSNFSQYALLYLPGMNDKIDFVVGRVCFFYGRRWKLQHEVAKAIDKIYAFFGVSRPVEAASTTAQAGFMMAGSEEERWHSSLEEYRRRYRGIGEKDLSLQMGFLRQILATCAERRIKVIVVNMPLTKINRELFPAGFYDRFASEVKDIATAGGATMVDLGQDAAFTDSDFWDTTHLNHAGGHKMVSRILPALTAGSAR